MSIAEGINRIATMMREDAHHVIALFGNVFDTIPRDGGLCFQDVGDLLTVCSEGKFPNVLSFDVFHGLRIQRGDPDSIKSALGIVLMEAKTEHEKLAKLISGKGGGSLPKGQEDAFHAMDTFLHAKVARTLVVIPYTDDFLNSSSDAKMKAVVALKMWARDEVVRANGHKIVLISREPISPLRDRALGIGWVRMGKPSLEELTAVFSSNVKEKEVELRDAIKKFHCGKAGTATDQGRNSATAAQFARLSVGLSHTEARTLAMQEEMSEKDIFARKREILTQEYGDILTLLEETMGFEAIGGMERQIQELRRIAYAMTHGEATAAPQGILLMGPPGTGKTLIARAFAKEAGMNCVSPRTIKDSLVGESEKRMERFLNALSDLTPVVVFVDEFDQSQPSRNGYDGDSGTSKGLAKMLMEAMADTSKRGKILWMMATNRPDHIDPAIKRPGRCDVRVPCLRPTQTAEIEAICKAGVAQYALPSAITSWSPFVARCRGMSGSEIVEIVLKAWRNAASDGCKSITEKDVSFALDDHIPQHTNEQEVAYMSLLALAECSSKSLYPEGYEEIVSHYRAVAGGDSVGNTDTEYTKWLARAPAIGGVQ